MKPLFPQLKPDPDINRLLAVLRRSGIPDRVPFFELQADAPFMEAVLGEPLVPEGVEGEDAFWASQRNQIRFWHGMGYDAYCARGDFAWPAVRRASAADTAALSKGERAWVQQEGGIVTSREQFEAYPWPEPVEPEVYAFMDKVADMLPDGMGMSFRLSGVLENIMWLMGYEGVSFALADDPSLVRDVANKVGERALQIYTAALRCEHTRFVVLGDDMGFKTQTMLPPDVLREHVFPWQKRIADLAHERGAPFVLHSCGKLDAIMDDLIDFVGIDAKHSFEDAIEPITEAKRKYGDRVALLGGIDVDKLARWDADAMRRHVRGVLAEMKPGGGYALGSGNSLANYLRVENYLAMMEEGWKGGKL